MSDQSLRAWHAKFAPPPEPCGENATVEELRGELARLRKQLKRAELEREIYKKSDGVFCQGVAVKYAWIAKHDDSFPIAVMCDVLDVSTNGYYASVDRAPSPRSRRPITTSVDHIAPWGTWPPQVIRFNLPG